MVSQKLAGRNFLYVFFLDSNVLHTEFPFEGLNLMLYLCEAGKLKGNKLYKVFSKREISQHFDNYMPF